MKKILLIISALVVCWGLFYACDDSSSPSSQAARVDFVLTDAPAEADYKAIWIDVQSVDYSISGESWGQLPMKPAKVDMLRFANGADTLLSNIELQAGLRIQQIRLHLGSENTLVLNDGTEHDLGTPSGQTSGLKINVHSEAPVTSGYKVVVDFDASRSIVVKGNGGYALKPVLRAFIEANTSSISGELRPANVASRVFTITAQKDTVATISDTTRNNLFVLRGLPSGSYDLQTQSLISGQISELKLGVAVMGGTDVDLGELELPM